MTKKSILEQLEIELLDAYDKYYEAYDHAPNITVWFSYEGFRECVADRLAVVDIDTINSEVCGFPYRIEHEQNEKYIVKVK